MKIRRLHWLLILPLALVLVILLAAGWTLRSEQGARWLFSRLAEMLPGRLEAVAVEGSLASGLELSGLVFEDGNARLEANAVSLAVNVDLLPPAVHVERLDARRLTVHMHGGGGEPTDWRALLPELALPIPVSVEDARVTEFDLRDSSGKKSLTLDGIELSARLHRDLVIDSLAVFTSAHRIELQGSMGFAAPYPLRAQLQSSGDSSIRFTADGTLSSAAVTLRSEQPRLDLNGRIGKLLSEPEWALEIASPLLEWPVGDPDVPIRARSLTAKSSGTLAGYRVTLNGILEADGLEPAQVELTGTGDDGSFAIDRLLMSSPEYLLRASGKSAWTAQPSLKLDAALERLDLHGWIPAWPDQQAVNGRLALAWDQHGLRLPDFELGIRDTPAKVSGEASIDTQTGSIDARLGWSALAWPPGSESPRIQSEIGALSASGRLEDWRIEGSINLEADGLAASDITLSGIGDSRSVELTLHRGSFLDGSVAGRLNWNWSGEMPFAVHLEGDNVSTTPLAPDFPGKLSTRVEAEGTLQPLEMEVTLHRLDGRVRDIPVSAKGGLHFGQGTVHARKLAARTGPSSFFIDGNLFDESGLNFELDVDSLSLYAPELEGRLKGNGLVSLYAGAPQFRARLSGSNLAFGDVTLSSIEIQDGDAAGGSELRLEGLDFDGQTIDSLTLVAAGAQPVQTIALNAAIGESAVEANLRGGIVDWTDPLGSGWSGLLAGLRLEFEDRFSLALDEPAALGFGKDHINLSRACFSGTRDATMCLDSAWSRQEQTRLAIELVSVPLGLVELATDAELEFSQILSGRLEVSRRSGSRGNGAARIEISPGAIHLTGEEDPILETGRGLFGFQLNDGNLQSGQLDIAVPGGGSIDIDFDVPDIRNGPDSAVQGRVRIKSPDISVYNRSVTLLDTMQGALDIDLMLSGTAADPDFSGSASFTAGQLANRASGLDFSEINLAGSVSEDDRSKLSGTFRAGEGRGRIEMGVEFNDLLSPRVQLSLQGESLKIIEVPDLEVIANPDISLLWANDTLQIDGRLEIPTARISPSHLPQNSVSESEDVVISAGDLPEGPPDAARERAVGLRGTLDLELGEQVVIDLEMAQARVRGRSRFNWQDAMIPMANGNFEVTGEIQAYGQLLRVTQGRISFPEIPADNPHLNIRAEREIFGNTQIRRAGLMVAGTLRRPAVEAYTVPATDKHRAQTLLITGSDFNFEQGKGAVDVGTYILPRLYVSYGIGIFEDGNVISARYDLGRGFGVKATSGERETGLDLNYRIER